MAEPGPLPFFRVEEEEQFERVDNPLSRFQFTHVDIQWDDLLCQTPRHHAFPTARQFPTSLPRLFVSWPGSVHKLVWKELLVYLILYITVSSLYHVGLPDDQRKYFAALVIAAGRFREMLPICTALGIYVGLVVIRWWYMYQALPYPCSAAILLLTNLPGSSQTKILSKMRQGVVRYINLSIGMTFSIISPVVRRKVNTLQHLRDINLLKPKEEKVLGSLEALQQEWIVWLPIAWAIHLINKSVEESYINMYKEKDALVEALLDIHKKCARLLCWYRHNMALAYSQLVSLAIYAYMLVSVVSEQYIDLLDHPDYAYKPVNGSAYMKNLGESTYLNYSTFPIYPIIRLAFYMGWLKVAQTMLDPFSEGDLNIQLFNILGDIRKNSFAIVDYEFHTMPVDADHEWRPPFTYFINRPSDKIFRRVTQRIKKRKPSKNPGMQRRVRFERMVEEIPLELSRTTTFEVESETDSDDSLTNAIDSKTKPTEIVPVEVQEFGRGTRVTTYSDGSVVTDFGEPSPSEDWQEAPPLTDGAGNFLEPQASRAFSEERLRRAFGEQRMGIAFTEARRGRQSDYPEDVMPKGSYDEDKVRKHFERAKVLSHFERKQQKLNDAPSSQGFFKRRKYLDFGEATMGGDFRNPKVKLKFGLRRKGRGFDGLPGPALSAPHLCCSERLQGMDGSNETASAKSCATAESEHTLNKSKQLPRIKGKKCSSRLRRKNESKKVGYKLSDEAVAMISQNSNNFQVLPLVTSDSVTSDSVISGASRSLSLSPIRSRSDGAEGMSGSRSSSLSPSGAWSKLKTKTKKVVTLVKEALEISVTGEKTTSPTKTVAAEKSFAERALIDSPYPVRESLFESPERQASQQISSQRRVAYTTVCSVGVQTSPPRSTIEASPLRHTGVQTSPKRHTAGDTTVEEVSIAEAMLTSPNAAVLLLGSLTDEFSPQLTSSVDILSRLKLDEQDHLKDDKVEGVIHLNLCKEGEVGPNMVQSTEESASAELKPVVNPMRSSDIESCLQDRLGFEENLPDNTYNARGLSKWPGIRNLYEVTQGNPGDEDGRGKTGPSEICSSEFGATGSTIKIGLPVTDKRIFKNKIEMNLMKCPGTENFIETSLTESLEGKGRIVESRIANGGLSKWSGTEKLTAVTLPVHEKTVIEEGEAAKGHRGLKYVIEESLFATEEPANWREKIDRNLMKWQEIPNLVEESYSRAEEEVTMESKVDRGLTMLLGTENLVETSISRSTEVEGTVSENEKSEMNETKLSGTENVAEVSYQGNLRREMSSEITTVHRGLSKWPGTENLTSVDLIIPEGIVTEKGEADRGLRGIENLIKESSFVIEECPSWREQTDRSLMKWQGIPNFVEENHSIAEEGVILEDMVDRGSTKQVGTENLVEAGIRGDTEVEGTVSEINKLETFVTEWFGTENQTEVSYQGNLRTKMSLKIENVQKGLSNWPQTEDLVRASLQEVVQEPEEDIPKTGRDGKSLKKWPRSEHLNLEADVSNIEGHLTAEKSRQSSDDEIVLEESPRASVSHIGDSCQEESIMKFESSFMKPDRSEETCMQTQIAMESPGKTFAITGVPEVQTKPNSSGRIIEQNLCFMKSLSIEENPMESQMTTMIYLEEPVSELNTILETSSEENIDSASQDDSDSEENVQETRV